ncbi:hypothetical protein BST61_g11340 [Cercospora zeina]
MNQPDSATSAPWLRLVGPERPCGEKEAKDANRDRDKVEASPEDAIRDHGRCCNGGDYSAHAIGTVCGPKYYGRVCEIGAKDVVEGKIESGTLTMKKNATTTTGKGGAQVTTTYAPIMKASDIIKVRARPQRVKTHSVRKALEMKPTALAIQIIDTIA